MPACPVNVYRQLRHSRKRFAKVILKEFKLPAASNSKAIDSIATFWEIQTYSPPLPFKTPVKTHTLRLGRQDNFFFLPEYKIILSRNIRFYNEVPEMHLYAKDSSNNLLSTNFISIRNVPSCNIWLLKTNVYENQYHHRR